MIKRNGIDVSKHQGTIEWEKVKASGKADFAIIRAGYGYTYKDPTFDYNIQNAIANGISVGVYWFIYALSEEEAVRNADKCHSIISAYSNDITKKVWCDFEYDSDDYAKRYGISFSKKCRTAIVKAFCERMKKHGYDVGVYSNKDYLLNKFDDLSEYPLWYALYGTTKGNRECLVWQYTSKSSVNGISGNVDMNIWYEEEYTKKALEEYAQEVISGKHGNGHESRAKSLKESGCPYTYETVREKVNELCSDYYNKYTGTASQIDTVLKAINVPSKYIGSWNKRMPIAKANGIKLYVGSGKQNTQLVNLAKQGRLRKV